MGYFRAYFGILRLLFEKRLICPHEILYRCSWCSFEFILGNVPLILHNCLIFSQETLYRCSWYNTLIVTNTIFFFFFWHHVPLFRRSFGAYFGILRLFLRTVQYVLMKFCIGVLGIRLRVTKLFLSISWPYWGALGGIFGLIFSISWETLNIF